MILILLLILNNSSLGHTRAELKSKPTAIPCRNSAILSVDYKHPCAMSLTFNVGLSHIYMHAHNIVCCCMNSSMEVFYYEVQIGK